MFLEEKMKKDKLYQVVKNIKLNKVIILLFRKMGIN